MQWIVDVSLGAISRVPRSLPLVLGISNWVLIVNASWVFYLHCVEIDMLEWLGRFLFGRKIVWGLLDNGIE